MLKRVLAFILVLALVVPAVQFNFDGKIDKVYAAVGSWIDISSSVIASWTDARQGFLVDKYGSFIYPYNSYDYSSGYNIMKVVKDGKVIYSENIFAIRSLWLDNNNTLWMFGFNGQWADLRYYSNGSFYKIWTIGSNISTFQGIVDSQNNIYINCGSSGLYIKPYNSNTVQQIYFPSEFNGTPAVIVSWATYQNNLYAVFNYNNVLYKYDGTQWIRIGQLPTFNSSIAVDSAGNIYTWANTDIYKLLSNNSWQKVYTSSFGTIYDLNTKIPGILVLKTASNTTYNIVVTNLSNSAVIYSTNSPGWGIQLDVGDNGYIYLVKDYSTVMYYSPFYVFSLLDSSKGSFTTSFDVPGEYNAILQRSPDNSNFVDVVPVTSSTTTDPYFLGNAYYYRLKMSLFIRGQIQYFYSNALYTAPISLQFGLKVSASGGLSWSNNSVARGTGYIVLNWNSIPNATGYKVWVWDGNAYRAFDVGNTTTWDSRVWRIWPDMNWLNSQGDNTISTDVFNHVQGGGQLPDDPNLLYRKTVGTTYDNAHNYWFRVSAYNQYGESPMSDAVTPTLPNMTDPNSPTITSFTINDGAAKTGSPQLKLSISASDTGGSGFSKIEISTDNFQTIQQTVNINPIGTNPTTGPSTYSVTISNFQVPATPGTVNVYVRAWDVAGNVSSVQKAQIALMNDVTPPTAQLKINNGAEFTTNPNVTLYITAYDDWTPIDQLLMRLSNDGKNWTPWSPLALTMNWTLDSSTQGYKTVFLQVQDASANIGTTSAGILYSTDPNVIRSTQLDTEPPKVDYLGLARGATVTTSYTPTITIVASDNVTPQNQLHVYASADGVNWIDLGYLTSANKILPSGLVQDGYNSIQIKIVDSSFNETIKTLSFFKL
ncbi:hypothetical protein V7D15_07250 [Thermoanaerobacter thermohydrosulfuricus]